MNTSDWTEIKRIFAEACELAPEERQALLDLRCAGKPQLRAEVEEYLRHHEQLAARPSKPADSPHASFAARLRKWFGEGIDPGVSLDGGPGSSADPASAGAPSGNLPTDALVRRLQEHALEQSRYKIQGEIARGGMGAILRVWDEDLRRHLAMKVILGKVDLASGDGTPGVDPRTLGRFLEEAQVTGQLDHPGIVPVHELGLDSQGRVYFTMKLVKGRDLKAIFGLVFAGQEGWNETRALGVILKACEAMAYAHDKGVIHRDLKPANVMVGNFGEVFVMDWGIARVLGRKDTHDIRIAPEFTADLASVRSERREEREGLADSPLVTMDGDVMGTPAYMAPEQARGEIEKLGPRSDVYSMGALLYHLLARHAPYLEPGLRVSSRTLLGMALRGPPAALASLRSDLPQELVAICEKAMAREAERRYADTLELAEDLRAFLEHRVVGAYETGTWAETRKWVQRNRALAASLATAVLLLVAGLTASLVYKARAEEKEVLATQKTSDVLSLSAIQDLKDLEDRADALWPATPEMVPKYEAWLADARLLIEGRPADPAKGIRARPGLSEHEAQLAEIRTRASPPTPEQLEADRKALPEYAEWQTARAQLTWIERMLGEQPWPSESVAEAALAGESLPTDARSLNSMAWKLINMHETTILHGSELRGLLVARRAMSAAKESERATTRNTLAFALYRCGRLDEALAEGQRVIDEAQGSSKGQLLDSVKRLEGLVESWMSEVGRSKHAAELAETRTRVANMERSFEGHRTHVFEGSEDRWWHGQLSGLVRDLRLFEDEKVGGLFSAGISEKYGWGIGRRVQFARTIHERSLDGREARSRWKEAIDAINRSPSYAGIKLTPQLGLLPIGADRDSGLWEFAHLQTGEPPLRGPDGKLSLNEGVGVVLVLIPGGRFWMGAQKTDPGGQNYDPEAQATESPVREVTLSPYFLSKYEMTQAQWERFTGKNPSAYRKSQYESAWNRTGKSDSDLHPVAGCSWTDCMKSMSRLELELPTEAQWEYGCRAGTTSVYWCGSTHEGLGDVANVADAYAHRHGGEALPVWDSDIDDGNTVHAEIGSFRANAFGLHEVHGNVWEWCADAFGAYPVGRQRDPVSPWSGAENVVVRGGGFEFTAALARSSTRVGNGARSSEGGMCGLRPARRVDP